jgi:hypothetical protein
LRSTALAGALAALILSAAAAPAAGASSPSRTGRPVSDAGQRLQLSDEQTYTRWAYAVTRGSARARPLPGSRRIGRLRLLTEDGFPEVYLLLTSQRDANGIEWVHVRLPQRPNGVTGWVRRSALGTFHLVHTWLVVDRRALRVTLYDRGRVRFRAPVGVGAAGTPTPAGSFWVRERFRVRGNSLYGTRAIGTAAYSNTLTDWPGGGVIGLHGTSEPGLIPGRPSHGCVRLKNRDIERLYELSRVGTPLLIK